MNYLDRKEERAKTALGIAICLVALLLMVLLWIDVIHKAEERRQQNTVSVTSYFEGGEVHAEN